MIGLGRCSWEKNPISLNIVFCWHPTKCPNWRKMQGCGVGARGGAAMERYPSRITPILLGIVQINPPPHTMLWREDNFVFGQIWAYVNLWHKSVIWDISSHIWWIKKQILGSKFSKNGPQKQKKWENAQKQPILDMFWCIRVTKSVLPEFCRSCKVIFCSLFTDEDDWEAEKSWNSVESVFCVKNAVLSPNHKLVWRRMFP